MKHSAQEVLRAMNAVDRAAGLALMNREDHVVIQKALNILRDTVDEVLNAGKDNKSEDSEEPDDSGEAPPEMA